MSTASISVKALLVPVRSPPTAVIRTGGLFTPLAPLPLRGYDYETAKPRALSPPSTPSVSAPVVSEKVAIPLAPLVAEQPVALATASVTAPVTAPESAPVTLAPVALAPAIAPVDANGPATVVPISEVPKTEVAAAAAADVIQPYTPSPETLEFLRLHKQINYDTQLVEVRTTGRLDADPFHRAHYPSVEPQSVPSLRVVQRSDTGAILGHVGGAVMMKFTPCQNAYLVESLHRAGMFEKMDAIRVDALKGGALVMIAMETKDEALMYETPMGSARFRMGFWNGHAGNHTVSVAPMLNLPSGGDVPLFTAAGGLSSEQNIRHTRSVNDTVADLSKAWGRSMELAAGVSTTLTALGDFKITRQEFDAVILASMNKTLDGRHSDIEGNAERFKTTLLAHTNNRTPETLLELADAVAAHIDFDRPVRNRKGVPEEVVRAESATVGAGARMKNAVLAEALAFLKRT